MQIRLVLMAGTLAAATNCIPTLATAAEIKLGLLSGEIASFCVNEGSVHSAEFSPYRPEDVGIDFRKIQIGVSQAPVAVSGGDLDMVECAGASGLMQAWRKGAKNAVIVFVGSVKPTYVLVGGKDVHTLSDMKGRVVASPGPQSTATEASTMMLKRGANLVDDRDYKLVSTGVGGARMAALAAGKIDAIPTYPPASYKMVDDGYHVIGEEAQYVPTYVAGTILVNKTWAAQNADTIVALLKTFLQTGAWLRDPARKQDVIARIAKTVLEGPKPMGEDHARRFYRDVIEAQKIAFDGYAPPEAFMSNLEVMTERGYMSKEEYPPLKDLVDYSYLNRALRELGMADVPEMR